MVINADMIELTQTPYSLLPGRQRFDCSGKQIVCPACAKILAGYCAAPLASHRRACMASRPDSSPPMHMARG